MRPSIRTSGRAVFRYRRAFIIFWAGALIVSVLFAPRLAGVTTGGGFDTPGSESARAADLLQEEFGLGYRRIVQILYHEPGGDVAEGAFRIGVTASAERVRQIPGVESVSTWYATGNDLLVSPDRSATYAIVNFEGGEDEIKALVPEIRSRARQGSALEVHVLGGPAFDYDLVETSERDLWQAEKYALPAIVVILIAVFGSLLAAGLPALLGGASVTVSLAILYFIGLRQELSVFVLNMVTMIGMGLGVDYSLFFVSRFREELRLHASAPAAVENTMATAGRAVVFSGAAVIVGMAMLVPFDFIFMRSLGVGGMVVAAVSVVIAVSLLPAALGVLGRRIDTARVAPARLTEGGGGRFWQNWSRMVMGRPVLFLGASVALLLALALPVAGMRAGSPGGQDLSPRTDSRQGLDLLAEKWGVGEASPIYIVIDTGEPFGALSRETRDGLARLEAVLAADGRVTRVESLADLELPSEPVAVRDHLLENPADAVAAATRVNIAGESDIAVARVVTSIEPTREETRRLVEDIRKEMIPGIASFGQAEAVVGGSAAETLDFTARLRQAFPYLVAAVMVITFFVLMLLFRSLILPVKAIFMNLLSVSAAYGVLVLVFQKGYGAGLLGFTPTEGIIPFVPVILFSILFGLSMDYEVFLLSRVKEEYDRGAPNEEAVTVGLQKTGRIITTAALIMIAVFASFALAESIIIKEFGVGLAVSIFLDATVVRVVLVPATMKLLGRWNWWLPGWLDRLLPDLSLRDGRL
ncbi:MAG: MMPL family transporter [Gaiellales bacterium]|nr:MAG: MMPL family transporter [Gaiellales bacterium]